MTSITFVCKDEDFTKEGAENIAEWILDSSGIKAFCDRVLVNNKEIWKLGDKTLKDILEEIREQSSIVKDK